MCETIMAIEEVGGGASLVELLITHCGFVGVWQGFLSSF